MKSLVQGLMSKSKKKQKGMTLVELLAVIVILGIVAAIGTVAIGGIIKNSRVNADNATMDMIEEAARLWVIDNNHTADKADQSIQTELIAKGYLNLSSLVTKEDSTKSFSNFSVDFGTNGEFTVTVVDPTP
jgi:type IV pilus assembly protein PilA